MANTQAAGRDGSRGDLPPGAMPDERHRERDLQAFNALLALWKDENPIKTTKLQVLLAVNSGLLAVAQINGGLVADNLLIMAGGFVVSLVWTLSIGRTCLFQKVWQIKMKHIASRYPDDPRFQILQTEHGVRNAPALLRALGSVSSKYYLLATPLVFTLAWLLAGILALA